MHYPYCKKVFVCVEKWLDRALRSGAFALVCMGGIGLSCWGQEDLTADGAGAARAASAPSVSEAAVAAWKQQILNEQGGPVRPLAQDFVVVGESPDAARIPVYTPSVLALPGGRLVASYEFGQGKMTAEEKKEPYTFILTSDDHGKTWQLRHKTNITHGRLFTAGGKVYLLGHHNDLRVVASPDNGETWGETVELTKGDTWHESACNVWKTRGNIYLVMEKQVGKEIKGWPGGEYGPVLMRAKETDDLTKKQSWTFSNAFAMIDHIPGYRENKLPFQYFGIPFYRQSFPNRTYVTLTPEEQAAYEKAGKKPSREIAQRNFAPMGWLESNVVQITDPNHYWYDPTGHTFHIFMRAHTGGTGYAAVLKAVEQDDGTIKIGFEQAPSGKTMLFIPFPGGQMRFHVTYDEKTKLYWLLCTQATDSMTRADKMDPKRFNLPNNERQRMALYFSKNMIDWCFAGLVTEVKGLNESRHYAGMDIDGDDLVILSRSGDARAESAHNGNLATFHRVKNFRNLVY